MIRLRAILASHIAPHTLFSIRRHGGIVVATAGYRTPQGELAQCSAGFGVHQLLDAEAAGDMVAYFADRVREELSRHQREAA